MVVSRGQDERSQMHAMRLLLNTCSGMTNRVLIDDGARWILQGDEQESENRTAGVKALYSTLAATTSGRARELVKQGISERNGMIAFGRIRERFGKTAGVAKLSDVFQFQWTTPNSLEDKWLRWQRLMRQVNMTSLDDDARETLAIAGLEKAKQRALEQQLRQRAPQTWTVLCASVDQYLRTTVDSGSGPTPMEISAVMSTCACCSKAGHEKASCRFRNAMCSNCGKTGNLRAMCRQREKSAGKSSPSSSSGKSSGKGSASSGSTNKCYCCGQVGHRRPDCPPAWNFTHSNAEGLVKAWETGLGFRGHTKRKVHIDDQYRLFLRILKTRNLCFYEVFRCVQAASLEGWFVFLWMGIIIDVRLMRGTKLAMD